MHYHAEVWVKDLNDPTGDLLVALAPHEEKHDVASDTLTGFWDWWIIGGRYTGAHTPGYDPEMDERNIETCNLCNGTGFRRDGVAKQFLESDPSYTCNGCGTLKDGKWTHGPHGPGKKVKWPSQWAIHLGDAMSVREISEELTAYTLIVNGHVEHMENWDGKEFTPGPLKVAKVKARLEALGVTTGYLITVDYHC